MTRNLLVFAALGATVAVAQEPTTAPVEGAEWDFGRTMVLDGGFLVPITPPVNRAPAPASADDDDAGAGSGKNPSGTGSGRPGTGRGGSK